MSEVEYGQLELIHGAVAGFAKTLIMLGVRDLEPGLRLLLEATGADSVSVEREIIDENGVGATSEATVDRKTVTDGPRVEARTPIVMSSRIAGSVVFTGVDRAWSSREIEILRAVGELIGCAWERQDADEAERSRNDALAKARDMDRTTSRSLLMCARSLLTRDDEASGQRAVDALRVALRVAVAYVDPVDGLVDSHDGQITAHVSATTKAREDGVPLWLQMIPWPELPGPNRQLAAGDTVVVGSTGAIDLRSLRVASGCPVVKAEIAVPVMVNKRWVATLGVADTVERHWTDEQRSTAEAVAELFGAHYTRRLRHQAIQRQLEARDLRIAQLENR